MKFILVFSMEFFIFLSPLGIPPIAHYESIGLDIVENEMKKTISLFAFSFQLSSPYDSSTG